MQPGTQLGPYEIVSALGKGGMGEVYRATDTRLDRTVAIKVLPEHLADRADLRERFEREAKAVSSLNHPHICTLHDIGEQDGIHYLVMEYVDGETLQQRLEKGRLPLDQALEYAIQIADALDKAHRQGVVHRDLKPGNIMVTKSGTKLLDFGLAKLKGDAAEVSPLSQMPTQDASAPLTAEGTILGTLQYMAPEQLEGKEADSRTDIFAFGAVVYEMVTGKKAFEGASQASLIAAIMHTSPQSLKKLQKMTPPHLDHIVSTCLAKDADMRWQTAADLMRELTWTVSTPGSESPEASTGTRDRVGWALFAAATIAVVLLILPGGEGPPAQVIRSEYVLPIKAQLAIGTPNPTVIVSPDGSAFMYGMFPSSGIFLRPFDAVGVTSIADVENSGSLLFSPEGSWVAYIDLEIGLMKVPITGGTPSPIIPGLDSNAEGITWGEGDTFVFTPDAQSGLWTVSADGGEPTELTALADGETSHRLPKFLPGGRAVLFTVWTDQQSRDDGQIAVYSFDDDTTTILLPGTHPQYAPTGHLVFAQGNRILAVPFDVARLEMTGTPVPVVENVLRRKGGVAQFSFSDTGLMMYVPADVGEPQRRLVWVDRGGRTEPVRDVAFGPHVKPRLSPEGNRIATFFVGYSAFDIWVYDLVTDNLQPVTVDGYRSLNMLPLWTPDGSGLTFQRDGSLTNDIYTMRVDETGEMLALTSSGTPVSYSPDGTLAFVGIRPGVGTGIFVLLPDGEVQDFLVTPQGETSPMFSPNGRFIAYVSDESGQNEIYVLPFPSRPGGPRKVSSEGGTEPVWARDGTEIYYRNGDRMIAAEVATGPFEVIGRTELFVDRFQTGGTLTPSYDVDPEGRFLMFEDDPDDSVRVILVQNWFEELKEQVPVP
jgi:serine/threonine protein kinase/Tol biopolymer transport system component